MPESIKNSEPFTAGSAHAVFREGDTLLLIENGDLTGFKVLGRDLTIGFMVCADQPARVGAFTTELRRIADAVDEYAQAYQLAHRPVIVSLPRCPACDDEVLPGDDNCTRCGFELGARGSLGLSYPTATELAAATAEVPNA